MRQPPPDASLAELSLADLDHVQGGKGLIGTMFGFLEPAYNSFVFSMGAKKGGPMLADKMYGSKVTAADRARATAAFHQYLVAGNKLPKGAPNLFG